MHVVVSVSWGHSAPNVVNEGDHIELSLVNGAEKIATFVDSVVPVGYGEAKSDISYALEVDAANDQFFAGQALSTPYVLDDGQQYALTVELPYTVTYDYFSGDGTANDYQVVLKRNGVVRNPSTQSYAVFLANSPNVVTSDAPARTDLALHLLALGTGGVLGYMAGRAA